jgi:tRNA(fMet)-specific endonuclease VapC
MLTWGTLAAELEKRGTPMPAVDSLIAAVALRHGLTIVTRNEEDFAHSGVQVLNPWVD